MPSLTEVRLGYDYEISLSDQVYVHLASRPNLALLQTSFRSTTLSITQTQEVVDQPFPELSYLQCASESKAFGRLGCHLARLTELRLDLKGTPSTKTVFHICSCTGLVSLELNLDRYAHFDAKSHFPSPPSCQEFYTPAENHRGARSGSRIR